MAKISSITPQQESLIPVYREKWEKIALSTDRIDRDLATKTIESVYEFLGRSKPKVLFLDSPRAIFENLLNSANKEVFKALLEEKKLSSKIKKPIFQALLEKDSLANKLSLVSVIDRNLSLISQLKIRNRFTKSFLKELNSKLRREIFDWNISGHIYDRIREEFHQKFRQFFSHPNLGYTARYHNYGMRQINFYASDIPTFDLINYYLELDYYISVLNLPFNKEIWQLHQELIHNCGFAIVPFEDVCYPIEKQIKISLNSSDRLHGNGESAIPQGSREGECEFADGFKIYAYNGVRLPEKYGEIKPELWQTKWLFSEANSERRRVLIDGIGYEKICQELGAIELNYWREYTLIKISFYVSGYWSDFIEEIYLLKMACPSTGHIHILRVPPTMKTAREAITWINHGIDPEMFTVET